MKTAVVAIFVVMVQMIFAYLLGLLLGESGTSFLLLILFALLTLCTLEIRNISGFAPNAISKVYLEIGYPDLCFLILSLIFLIVSFSNSIELTLTEYTNKGFITFSENLDVFFQLRTQLIGDLGLQLFLGALGLYGFRLRTRSFSKLFKSTALGLFLGIIIIILIRRNWTGLENFIRATGNNISSDYAPFLGVIIITGSFLAFALAIAVYIWVASFLTTALRNRIKHYLPMNEQNVSEKEQDINDVSNETPFSGSDSKTKNVLKSYFDSPILFLIFCACAIWTVIPAISSEFITNAQNLILAIPFILVIVLVVADFSKYNNR